MREIVVTKDGSHTIAIPSQQVTYHSVHGAIQESKHVFIEAGLHHVLNYAPRPGSIHIFEMGFGTGLNAFLTAIEAAVNKQHIHYTTIETSPLFLEEAALLNYTDSLGHKELFDQLHQSNWNDVVQVNEFFTLEKIRTDLTSYAASRQFHIIYYDAFAPSAQPELWTADVFRKLYETLLPEGILVTYCSKGDVRRAMQAAGFTIEKIPGPPGKREMVRATSPPGPLLQSSRGEKASVVEEPFPKYSIHNLVSFENARINRKEHTEAEGKLWEQLRNNKLGCKFRRQHPVEGYIADFVCLQKGLIIEVDGGYHNTPEQIEADAHRTAIMQQKGFTVLRFTNEEVLQNVYAVRDKIKQSLSQ